MEHCDGCGHVWDRVAAAQLAPRLAEIGPAYRRVLLPPDRGADWAERASARPAPVVWSAIEYACHVRDVLLAQRDRMYLALVEQEPTFTPIYRDERAELAHYAVQDLAEVVAQVEMAGALAARAFGQLDRAQLSRTCVYAYPTTAVRSLVWLGSQTVHEAEHHLLDIAAQLAPFDAGLEHVRRAPVDDGRLDLIVRRPAVDSREVLAEGVLDVELGLVGDSWTDRPSRDTPDGSPSIEAQLNIMSSRAAGLIAGELERWALAGDQLFVDLDLSEAVLPAGTRLAIGEAVIEITAKPHSGCAKFSQRFGRDALRAVNSTAGRALRLRGVCAKVVVGGTVCSGDPIRRVTGG